MSPPSTTLWIRLADGRTLLPEFSLANMLRYFVTRKVCDGNVAEDFKHINSHSYPLFKAGNVQGIESKETTLICIYLPFAYQK